MNYAEDSPWNLPRTRVRTPRRFRRPRVEDLERRLLLTRITDDLVVLYTFENGSGNVVSDVSGNGTPLDLIIDDTANVTWSSDSLTINAGTLISSQVAATKVLNEITASEEITVEAWVTPLNNSQTGPARIVTMSSDESNRNFTLSARARRYDARFRTTATGLNGNAPPVRTPNSSLQVALTHVVYTRSDAGVGSVYLDGVLRATETIGGNLSNWDPSYQFGLVNELSGTRPWLGTLDLVAVYSQALSPADIALNFGAGPDPVSALPTVDIVDVNPDPRASPVGAVTIDFSVPVSGVSIDDFSLTRDGQNVDLGALAVTTVTSQEYQLDLSSVTQSPGSYQLALSASGSGIQDSSGNALSNDATDTFVIGTAPVASITDVVPDPALLNAGIVSTSFSESVTGVDIGDFTLVRDGNTVSLAGVSVVETAPSQYSMDLSAVTTVGGNYTLTLVASGSGIQGAAGVPLVNDATASFDVVVAPNAIDDSFSTAVDQSVVATAGVNGLLENDSDPNGIGALVVDPVPVADVSHGLLTLNPNGAFQYDPNAGFVGTDTFTYRVTNGFGLTSTADVTIQVADPTSGPKLRSGVAAIGNSSWTTVTLNASYNVPVVVASVIHDNPASPPLVTRVNNTGSNSFDLRLDRADGLTGSVTADVHYLVVEAGTYTVAEHGVEMEAFVTTSTRTDRSGSWVAEDVTGSIVNAYSTPVVLGQVITYNDPNWSAFWTRGGSQFQPPVAGNIRVGKHVGKDPNATRADEDLGIIVFEAGSGTVDGVDYVASLGVDSILGVDDGGGSYGLALANPETAVVTQAAMDGGDGGWAVLNGGSPLANSTINIAIEEEAISDLERNHTNEQVAWVAFAGGGDTDAPTASISDIVPALRNVPVENIDVTFSEPVVGLEISDFSLTRDGLTVDISGLAIAGSGDQYSLDPSTVTTAAGNYLFTLNASTVQDLSGNALLEGASQSFEVDTSSPTADIIDVIPDPRETAADTVTITFNEAVTGVDVTDFELTRDSVPIDLSGVVLTTISEQEYRLDLASETGLDGSYQLLLSAASSGIADLAGNSLIADATDAFSVDGTPPTADISDVVPDPRTTAAGIVTVNFSEPVTGVVIGAFGLTRDAVPVDISAVSLNSLSQQEYALDLSGVSSSDGNYELTLNAPGAGIQDLAGNPLTASSTDMFVVDSTGPTVDIVDVMPDPRVTPVGIVTILFSEDITGVDSTDLALTKDGSSVDISTAPFTSVSQQEYTIDLSGFTTTSGSYELSLNPAGSAIADIAGNSLTGGATDTFDISAGPTADILDVFPDPTNSPVASVQVSFDEDVTGVTADDFSLVRDGLAVDLTGLVVSSLSAQLYELDLSSFTAIDGSYELTLVASGSGVQNLLNVGIAADAFDSFVVDQTPPTADFAGRSSRPAGQHERRDRDTVI